MTAPENDRTVFLQPESVGKGGGVAAPAVPAVPAVPPQLGKYPLRELVGAGSIGVVYKSSGPDGKREFAIKAIPLSVLQASGEQSLAQLRIGIQKAQGLSHPNIVPIKAYGEEAGFAYIAMDWIKGQSLATRFEQKARFSIEQVVDIQSQLLQALQYVHDRGLSHGNLKAADILITTNGRVRVKGFGLARSTYSNVAADQLSDVHAAGAMFYELLTGIPPYARTPNEASLPPSEVTRRPSLRPYDAVALQALERDPEDRLPSAAQFLESLLTAYVYEGDPADAADKTLAGDKTLTRELSAAVEMTTLLTAQESAEPGAVPAPIAAAEPIAPVRPDPGARTVVLGWPVADNAAAVVAEPGSAAGRDTKQLAQIQQRLMLLLGPIAVIMVRRAERETADMAALIQWLAARIDDLPERERFLTDTAAMSLTVNTPAEIATPPILPVHDAATQRHYGLESLATRPPSGEDIARASQLLLSHLGPIAPVLVKRAAQQPGCSRDQFIATLAGHLTDEVARAKFLAALA